MHHAVAAAVLFLSPAAAQPAPDALAPAQIREVVDSTIATVEARYVSADTGRIITDRVRARRDAGAYDALGRPDQLGEALTADLRAHNGDRHLRVVQLGGGGGSGGAPFDPAQAERRANYGFTQVERLDGNVGYVKLIGLSLSDQAQDVAVTALEFIRNTDAVILDLRGAIGGSGLLAHFLISHFTAPDLLYLGIYRRRGDSTELRRTLAEVPGPRRTDVPLYVLIDRGSVSAAETVPFALRNLGRATLVGERTAGAGRNNQFFPVGHGLAVSVSVSRVTDPVSGREWERVGVQPDLAVPSEQALAAAHQDALRRLAQAEPDETRRAELLATAEYVGARAAPAALPVERLARCAGRYADGRIVTVEGDRLFYQPAEDEPRRALLPLADGRFAAGPLVRAEFAADRDGRTQLRLSSPGEPSRAFDRVQ